MNNFKFKKEIKKLLILNKTAIILGSIFFVSLFILVIGVIVKKFMSNPIYGDDNLDVIPSNYEINETFLLIMWILFLIIVCAIMVIDWFTSVFIAFFCKEIDCKKLLVCGCFGMFIPLIPFYFATKILKTINDELNSQPVNDLQKNNMQFNSKYNNLNGNYNYFPNNNNNNICNNPQNNSQNLYKSADTNMNNNFNNSDDELCTKIKKIYELKEKGIITEDEFQDLKKNLI